MIYFGIHEIDQLLILEHFLDETDADENTSAAKRSKSTNLLNGVEIQWEWEGDRSIWTTFTHDLSCTITKAYKDKKKEVIKCWEIYYFSIRYALGTYVSLMSLLLILSGPRCRWAAYCIPHGSPSPPQLIVFPGICFWISIEGLIPGEALFSLFILKICFLVRRLNYNH